MKIILKFHILDNKNYYKFKKNKINKFISYIKKFKFKYLLKRLFI
jgi:hypothetical protein